MVQDFSVPKGVGFLITPGGEYGYPGQPTVWMLNPVGLTRRKWPKKTNYTLISDEEIALLEYKLNTPPRKHLGYLTPVEYTLSIVFTA
ncbi:MAG: hypothetical protein JXR70_18115 [Spirochaetales bacterium]|nr:hypothetical protein [Spirochaetales bacterium]